MRASSPARPAGTSEPEEPGPGARHGAPPASRQFPPSPSAGLSLRVRENLADHRPALGSGGSIPACAGEPRPSALARSGTWVYPRVCGGTPDVGAATREDSPAAGRGRYSPCSPLPGLRRETIYRDGGLPSLPGGRGRQSTAPAAPDSTPIRPPGRASACAPPRPPVVYPRVCGGTASLRCQLARPSGLSPRVRGNPWRTERAHGRHGSIPACAGEPRSRVPRSSSRGVYPRVCGGTRTRPQAERSVTGLSPRVRGNRLRALRRRRRPRSIPACAGEPFLSIGAFRLPGVYPRVCGGTLVDRSRAMVDSGLSPRVRGNLRPAGSPRVTDRSIPACAGEPKPGPAAGRLSAVYPRVCGGTVHALDAAAFEAGLSPRVRGNLAGHGLPR